MFGRCSDGEPAGFYEYEKGRWAPTLGIISRETEEENSYFFVGSGI